MARNIYGRGKYGNAAASLVGSADIYERLDGAFMSFYILKDTDFDDAAMVAKHQEIMRRLTAVKTGPKAKGYMPNTLAAMNEPEASAIADLILELYVDLVEADS